jgi:glycerol dehydrogenase-like iron-containing ADH family enzyme
MHSGELGASGLGASDCPVPASPARPPALSPLVVAPGRVIRGPIAEAGSALARLGRRPLVVGGDRAHEVTRAALARVWADHTLSAAEASTHPDCSEATLERLHAAAEAHQADCIVGVGGGKSLDTAKLLAHQRSLPVATVPTTGATCAAWTALSNVYSDTGAFRYDVSLDRAPDLLILDYAVLGTAPARMLVAGIGDAIAKWYEASVSSGQSERTLIIAAVQQARVLRDLLFQKSVVALKQPHGEIWRDVVDATVLLAGVIGGVGGAQCRTVAAHAVHNGLTHLSASHGTLHGEKVAFGILVQLRLEEMLQGSHLAATARQQLLGFYEAIALPRTLADLGLGDISLPELHQAAEIACAERSDIHRLPFAVTPAHVMAAMVSTTVPPAPRPAPSAPDASESILAGEVIL